LVKCSLALIKSTSSLFLHFFKTKIHTGIPVEKNSLAGANPPFSLRWNPTEELAKDFRFADYRCLAPKSAADFAFLLHGFHFLDNEGTMAIILPHGVLFRGGAEAEIRKKLHNLQSENL
jgi:type I restriction-modification system DNA methylase subunit